MNFPPLLCPVSARVGWDSTLGAWPLGSSTVVGWAGLGGLSLSLSLEGEPKKKTEKSEKNGKKACATRADFSFALISVSWGSLCWAFFCVALHAATVFCLGGGSPLWLGERVAEQQQQPPKQKPTARERETETETHRATHRARACVCVCV
jgi:hypothetical protein